MDWGSESIAGVLKAIPRGILTLLCTVINRTLLMRGRILNGDEKS
jgi:hypothetical protein